ncbi:class I lanthipeptide [Chitinophaga nivalis]|uniref:Class I lanthipeptide n=1 Tax=Chitinophaga nivalis TaxID=2991709 RepID=A0ABT3ING5_9BACT|nr:class I lanthipeptide [Chitinophaga nivalis]MCW3465049.1 class I lanthipeptide [Chitinophaga nivalis]MCW3485259.1 class I lanthipeptide [Chitinophaga nivalis]
MKKKVNLQKKLFIQKKDIINLTGTQQIVGGYVTQFDNSCPGNCNYVTLFDNSCPGRCNYPTLFNASCPGVKC